jgi:hypothetical protein
MIFMNNQNKHVLCNSVIGGEPCSAPAGMCRYAHTLEELRPRLCRYGHNCDRHLDNPRSCRFVHPDQNIFDYAMTHGFTGFVPRGSPYVGLTRRQ